MVDAVLSEGLELGVPPEKGIHVVALSELVVRFLLAPELPAVHFLLDVVFHHIVIHERHIGLDVFHEGMVLAVVLEKVILAIFL